MATFRSLSEQHLPVLYLLRWRRAILNEPPDGGNSVVTINTPPFAGTRKSRRTMGIGYHCTMHAATYRNLRQILVGILLFGAIAVIASYAYLKFAALLRGPSITVTVTPPSATTTPLATIAGVAKNAKSLTLAGRPIFIDLEGKFSEKLLLFPGYNIIELAAKDVRGKEVRHEIELVHAEASIDGKNESSATTSPQQYHLSI